MLALVILTLALTGLALSTPTRRQGGSPSNMPCTVGPSDCPSTDECGDPLHTPSTSSNGETECFFFSGFGFGSMSADCFYHADGTLDEVASENSIICCPPSIGSCPAARRRRELVTPDRQARKAAAAAALEEFEQPW